jgi:glutamate dehydrogenase
VRAESGTIEIENAVRRFEPGAKLLAEALPGVLEGADRESYDARVEQLTQAGVAAKLAEQVAAMASLPPVFDIVAVAEATGRELGDVMETYFGLASRLGLNWVRDRILELPRGNRWQALARAALRDDLLSVHRELTREVLETADKKVSGEQAIEQWSEGKSAALERCLGTLADIRASGTYDTTTLPVALREVRRLISEANGDEQE